MKNDYATISGDAYVAPEIHVEEVLVEQGFQASLDGMSDPGSLDYGEDYDEFE